MPAHSIDAPLPAPSISGFALAVAGVFFIAAGVVMSIASDLGPIATAFWRFAFGAGICGAMTCLVNGSAALGELRALVGRRHIWVAGLAFSAVVALWYTSLRMSSVATTSALHNLSPLLLALWGWPIFARQVARVRWRVRLPDLPSIQLCAPGSAIDRW